MECQQFGESISVFPLKDGDVIKGTIKLGFLYKNEIITSNFQNLKSLQTGFANLKPKERSETQETFLRGIDISESEIKVYGNNVFSTFDQSNSSLKK